MIRQIVVFTALLVAKVMAEAGRYQTKVSAETRYQSCNDISCDCGATKSSQAFKKCNQACTDARCKALTCSSGICHQECHSCHMECTSDVDYCRQRCLSRACSFTCNAKHCERRCKDGICNNISSSDNVYKLPIPRGYLVLLAALFALVAIFSLTLLVLLLCKGNCCRTNSNYLSKHKILTNSLESLDSVSSFV